MESSQKCFIPTFHRVASYLCLVVSVFGNEISDEDFVRRLLVKDFESQFKGITHLLMETLMLFIGRTYEIISSNLSGNRTGAGSVFTYLGRIHIVSSPLGDLHEHVWRLDDGLFEEGRFDLALDGQVEVVDDRAVGQVVLAIQGQAQICKGK